MKDNRRMAWAIVIFAVFMAVMLALLCVAWQAVDEKTEREYRAGYEAGLNGVGRDHCPWVRGNRSHLAWHGGWSKGFEERERSKGVEP